MLAVVRGGMEAQSARATQSKDERLREVKNWRAGSSLPEAGKRGGSHLSYPVDLVTVTADQASEPLISHLSSALAKRCLSAALKGAGPPVWTPAERSSSMKLRMPSRACMVSRV